MINGSHVILFSPDPEADRAFFAEGVSEERWGRLTRLRLPGGGEVGLYEPRHPLAIDL